ncbi:MAG: M23 family metallopeptidase [Candidatus Blackburnbacteria bacterium]|nr:M23 family metallopeptidase [Candidatus Blackburnbacteria bacterium]
MLQININLGSYSLRVKFSKIRGREDITSFFPSFETIKNFRAGNKISRFFRHMLERLNIRSILGGNLALFAVISGIITPASTTLSVTTNEPEINLLTIDQPISTEVVVQYPISPVVINQGYYLFHPGIDLDGVTGDLIRPIMKGMVFRTERSRYAYGNSIIVDHGNGFSSRYAHLSIIDVKEGDTVETRTIIGKVGSTGRSTGDHLHLEVYQNGRTINPLTILPRYR